MFAKLSDIPLLLSKYILAAVNVKRQPHFVICIFQFCGRFWATCLQFHFIRDFFFKVHVNQVLGPREW